MSGERRIGAVRLTLIKVADERLGGTEEVTTSDGPVAVYASRARALVDAVYDWARFNSLRVVTGGFAASSRRNAWRRRSW